jgi:hypothetical protein
MYMVEMRNTLMVRESEERNTLGYLWVGFMKRAVVKYIVKA